METLKRCSVVLAKSLPVAAAAVNAVLRPLNLKLQYQQQWDRDFRRWVRREGRDVDPNDAADAEWGSDLLDEGIRDHYMPLLSPDAVIVELGPGSGRLTRHLIGRCRELIVADNSKYVCKWMHGYLAGKGRFQVHHIRGPWLPMLGDGAADAVVAHGVFEHLDLDETYWFLSEFARVLRPGGMCSFNFDSPATPDGIAIMRRHGGPGHRSVYRLHHPESIRCVAAAAGFASASITQTDTRIAFADLTRGPAGRDPAGHGHEPTTQGRGSHHGLTASTASRPNGSNSPAVSS